MKVTKTFTIDNNVYKEFNKLSKQNSINKSLFLENCMKKFIEQEKNKIKNV